MSRGRVIGGSLLNFTGGRSDEVQNSEACAAFWLLARGHEADQ